ncbi:unnamed protein product [Prorocentrum cordatum]|uniref:Phosphoglycerate mutase (2,3-diphosphoglycerate-dependent) n=1 Tax=Prorocentrum cordatum TaxID=2364126 RepID=A0ABN9TQV3_9DINO|nr:unnamed protein product [Polarella glacialis]
MLAGRGSSAARIAAASRHPERCRPPAAAGPRPGPRAGAPRRGGCWHWTWLGGAGSAGSAPADGRILLIRHGESAMNVQPELVGGRTDAAPLTQRGQAQARALGRRLRATGVELDEVYSSTAERARRTYERWTYPCRRPASSLAASGSRARSWSCARANGRGAGARRCTPLRSWARSAGSSCSSGPQASPKDAPPSGRAPAGESQWDVEERVVSFVERLLERPPAERPGEGGREHVIQGSAEPWHRDPLLPAACVGRAACLRRAQDQTENTAVSEVLYRPGSGNLDGWVVVRTNDAAHLEGLAA